MSNQSMKPAVINGTYLESYPSLREPEPEVFLIVAIFLLCFVVGIVGNASTLTQILGFGAPKQFLSVRAAQQLAHDRFLRVYVVCLILADSLMLLGLPTAITESLIGFWVFGSWCKFHHLANCVGRIASNLVLTSMTVENFLVTTAPQKYATRHTTGLLVLLLGAAASSVLLLPVLIFANAQRVFLFESRSRNGQAIQIRIFKCVDGMPTNLLFWSTGMNFVIGYFVPFALIAVFNGLLFVRLRKNQRKIVYDIVYVALSRFVFWMPYWLSVLYVSYVDLFESRTIKTLSNGSEQAMVFLYFAHIMPYLNASLNWLLYARLARDLASQFPPAVHRNGLHEAPSFTHNLADNQPSDGSWAAKRPNEESVFATSRVVRPSPLDPVHSNEHPDSPSRNTLLPLEFQKEIETFDSL
ncbi:hypothetical protein M3Y99_01691400 [Aphelenchoides fujianensis]|nr:hypothetical protein M3Y99_01691400 [Aphelenchoides fujianensis]